MTGAGEIDRLRERVALACRVLGSLELAGTTGHVSARIPGTERVLIRARGPGELGVPFTQKEQIVEVGFDGELVRPNDQGLKSPIEVYIHTEVYRKRPDVHSVVHVHPPTVVLFTVCDKPLLPIIGAYHPAALQLLLDGIPTYERSTLVSSAQRGRDLAERMGAANVCLMRGHGITAAAGSVEEAALAAIYLNELASMNYRAYLLGKPAPIASEDQEEFRSLERPDGMGTAGEPQGRAVAAWRYYRTLTGQTS